MVAELAEVDALPRAEVEMPVGDGDGETRPHKHTLHMRGHVVGPFEGVAVARVVLLDERVEDRLHVGAHVGVAVFVDGESAAGVFHKDVDQSRAGQRGHEPHEAGRDEVKTAGHGGQGDFKLGDSGMQGGKGVKG